jgi:ATP-dependent exoDNAse (exonuclease V) beta subunit
LECPTKYYLRYQLGLPEEDNLPYYNEADTHAENVQGSMFGQILHKVLEKAGSFVSSEFIDMSLLQDVFDIVCSDLHLSDEDRAKYSERVRTDIQNVFSNDIGKQALKARQYFTELPLRAKLQSGQMLSGIIDRLFLDDEGIWNILDYKTDTRENVQKKDRYEFQLEFYAYLVSLLYGQETVKAHVLYTHSGNTLSFTFTQKDFAGIGKKLQTLVSEIRAQKKAKSLEEIERKLSHCPECPYFDWSVNLCVAGAGTEPIPLQTELLFTN